jgi:hypothetical protein
LRCRNKSFDEFTKHQIQALMLLIVYIVFKGINELAEGLGFVSFVSRQPAKQA